MLKRSIDIAGAAAGLVLLAPLIAALIVVVKRSSPGPGIFSQVRVGRNCAPFRCHKLRTMYAGTPNVPSHEAGIAQVTPIGCVLRHTKLDELPQLWNVLLGEMSFVGPRPCLPSQHRLIEERMQRGVLVLRPGITGLAQIRGIDMSDPARLAEADAEYLQNRSLWVDLVILYRTVFRGAGSGDRVRL